MLSVSNVSMRYGAKILFDEVSTAFTPGDFIEQYFGAVAHGDIAD